MITLIYENNMCSGLGHFSRCSKLLDTLLMNNINCTMIEVSKFLSLRETDLNKIAIIDISLNSHLNLYKHLGAYDTKIGLDWFNKEQLDFNIVVYPHSQPAAKYACYVGFDYLIIDKEIVNIKPKNEKILGPNVLVVIGGGDIKEKGTKSADFLHSKGFKVHLVEGPNVRLNAKNREYQVSKNVKNMAQLIEKSDWMVTNGGSCLFEACVASRPSIALPQTLEEEVIVKQFKEKGAIIGDTINDIYSSYDLDKIKQNGKRIIDGKGLQRIVNIIRTVNK